MFEFIDLIISFDNFILKCQKRVLFLGILLAKGCHLVLELADDIKKLTVGDALLVNLLCSLLLRARVFGRLDRGRVRCVLHGTDSGRLALAIGRRLRIASAIGRWRWGSGRRWVATSSRRRLLGAMGKRTELSHPPY